MFEWSPCLIISAGTYLSLHWENRIITARNTHAIDWKKYGKYAALRPTWKRKRNKKGGSLLSVYLLQAKHWTLSSEAHLNIVANDVSEEPKSSFLFSPQRLPYDGIIHNIVQKKEMSKDTFFRRICLSETQSLSCRWWIKAFLTRVMQTIQVCVKVIKTCC